ncbi:unnamed protein product, partial [Symbiodinium necroappetens]
MSMASRLSAPSEIEFPKSNLEERRAGLISNGTNAIPTPTSGAWRSPGRMSSATEEPKCRRCIQGPSWHGGPRLPSPSPCTADGTYSTIHRKHAVDLYYQGINEGTYNTIHRKHAGDLYHQGTDEEKPTRDEKFEQEVWNSILDYVPGIHNEPQKLPRKSKKQRERAGRAQKTTDTEPSTRQPPTAQSPSPETSEVTRGDHGSKSSRPDPQTSTTNTTAPTRGVLRGLSPLAAGAARAIPQATKAPDDAYYQKAAPQGAEHEAKETHTHLVPTKTILETHNNDAYYPTASASAFDAQPQTAQLVPPGGRAPQYRGLHPDQDVFEDASPTREKLEPHDYPQDDSGEPSGTAMEEVEGPDWSRDSQDEADEGNNDDTTNQNISEPPSRSWGSRRPAEPEGPPPPKAPNGRTRNAAPLREETRTERNRRERAEWRE